MGSFETPIVGREDELAALALRVRALAAGAAGGLVAIEGEPGIGKTRLADETCARARELGLVVARGAALADAGAPALTAWRAIARVLDPEVRAALGAAAGAADTADAARWQRFSAIADAFAAASARRPLVVLVDDLHDADAESLALLAFLARDLRDAPVLFVTTLRDRGTRDAGAREAAIARLLRDATVMRLAPLSEGAVRAMARHAGHDDLAERVLGASRGNPLFVVELLALARAGATVAGARVPESIAAVVRARLRALATDERETLDVAALLGADVRIPLLARALGRSPEATLASLGPAVRMRLLDDDGSLRLRFAHPLFRETLEGDLAADRRRQLHARIGQALLGGRAAGIDVAAAEIAHHLAAALPIGSIETALEWLERARADAEARLSFEEVASLAARAAEVGAASGLAAARACDLELAAARARSRAGQRSLAREAAARGAAHARAAADPRRLARAALARGADFTLGIVDQGLVGELRSALAALSDADRALAARLEARLAAALQPAPDPLGPVGLAREALAKVRGTGDDAALLDVMMSAGSAYADYAPVEERRALAREMIALATALSQPAVAHRGTLRLAIDSLDAGDLETCDRVIEEHDVIANALGAPHYRWTAPVLRAMRAAMRGDRATFDRSHREARAIADRAEDPNAYIALAHQRFVLGIEWVTELELRAIGDEIAERCRSFFGFAEVERLLRGLALVRHGSPEASAHVRTIPLEHPLFDTEDNLLAIAAEIVALAWPERAGDLVERVARKRGRDVVWGPFSPGWDGPWERRHALLARALGDHAQALASFEAALARSRGLGARMLAARLEMEIAETLDARGRPADAERARLLRESAAREADAMGMTLVAAQARAAAKPRAIALVSRACPFTLARDGETWSLVHAGATHRLRDSRGLRWLARLVAEPDRDFHVLELAGAEDADTGDGGELLDAKALAAYRGRATALREALDEAESNADLGAIEAARAELDALTDEIARSVGLGGRSRRAAGAVERARVNVQRRLRDATGRIAALDPALGAHLEWAVRTGTLCRYRTR